MKKVVLLAVIIAPLFSSCFKVKDYTCKCDYVPNFSADSSATQFSESFTVQGRFQEQANSECQITYEGKYFGQGFDGACQVQ